MKFNLLLTSCGIDPEDVSLVFHTTRLAPLKTMLPWLVAQRRDLFEAYESVHSSTAERTLAGRPFYASFVPCGDADMLFTGLYEICSKDFTTAKEIYSDPRFGELAAQYGASDTSPERNLNRDREQRFFVSKRLDHLSELRGRLTLVSPAGRAYVRLAANLDPEVLSISAESRFEPAMPPWREVCLSATELRSLPVSWANRLKEWRGIYLIVDQVDGERYVGSAYGAKNLFGRWQDHVATDVGVTTELRHRDPANFRFTILERVSPDLTVEEIVPIENNWKRRLDTITNGLNLT